MSVRTTASTPVGITRNDGWADIRLCHIETFQATKLMITARPLHPWVGLRENKIAAVATPQRLSITKDEAPTACPFTNPHKTVGFFHLNLTHSHTEEEVMELRRQHNTVVYTAQHKIHRSKKYRRRARCHGAKSPKMAVKVLGDKLYYEEYCRRTGGQ